MAHYIKIAFSIVLPVVVCFAGITTANGQDNVVQIPPRQQQPNQAPLGRQASPSVQGGPVARAAGSPDAEFRTAVQNLVNSYRGRGVSNSLLNRVQNAASTGGGNTNFPRVRIRNIDPYGRVYIFFDRFGPPVATLGPGQLTSVFPVSGTVFFQAAKQDQFGNSKVTDIQIEHVAGPSPRFWDGDDFRHFLLLQGRRFPRGLNDRADLSRYRLER